MQYSGYESTIGSKVAGQGIGLHSGKEVYFELVPAPEGAGIHFIRADRGGVRIPVAPCSILPSSFCTAIGTEGDSLQTVEHLLSAVAALGIDNLTIVVDGPEVPILDGSALPFVKLLLKAGICRQRRPRSFIQFVAPVTVSAENKYVSILPSSQFEVAYQIKFDHPAISHQRYFYRHSAQAFVSEIAAARTFGFLKDVPALLAKGLARGGSLENSIVVGDKEVLNRDGLRFSDEFVRHKILDLIGDLSLLGRPILGRVEASCSGHRLHALLIQKILNEKNAWKVVHADETSEEISVESVSIPSMSLAGC